MSDRDNPTSPSGDPADDGTQPPTSDDATSTPAEYDAESSDQSDVDDPRADSDEAVDDPRADSDEAVDGPRADADDVDQAGSDAADPDDVDPDHADPDGADVVAAEPAESADAKADRDDDVPREPSKYELDQKNAEREASAPTYPEGSDEVAEPKKIAPSKWAQIFLGLLAALLIGFGILSLSQDAEDLHKSIMPQQVAVVAQYLEEDDGPKLSEDQLKSAQESWQDSGDVDDPSGDRLATVINEATGAGSDEQVTAEQVDKVIEDNKLNLTWTLDEVQSMLTRQAAMFLVGGAIAAIALIFYRQAKAWARVVGMFISGLAGIMFLMQVVQGGLNIFSLLLTIAGIGSFYFLIKGRLQEAPTRATGFGGNPGSGGMGGFGGLGGLFKPRRPNDSA